MARGVLIVSLAAALSLAGAASAQSQEQAQAPAAAASDQAAAKTAVTGDPNRRVCKTVKVTGTRLGKAKVCRTALEWAEQTTQNRQDLEKAQTQTGLKGN